MIDALKRAGQWLVPTLLTLSGVCLVMLMALTVVEVVGRYAFNAPIFGRQDIAQILLACAIFFAFPVVTLREEQITVDLLDAFIVDGVSFWRDRLIGLLTSAVLLVMGYWLYLRADRFQSRGITSELLFLPKHPLVYGIAAIVFASGVAIGFVTLYRIFKRLSK